MTEEKKSGSWMTLILKTALVFLLALLPAMGVISLLLVVGFVPQSWIGPSTILSLVIFLVGATLLIISQNVRYWAYLLLIGFLVAPVVMTIAGIVYLSLMPVPYVGNALNLVLLVIMIGGGTLALLASSRSSVSKVTTDPGLIAPSVKGTAARGMTQGLGWRQQEMVAAIELEEIPRSYAYPEDDTKSAVDMVPRFLTVLRHLTLSSVPFSFRLERRDCVTSAYFLTWSKDDVLLNHQKTVLQDTLQSNLQGFRFRSLGYFEGFRLVEGLAGAAVEVNGTPCSVEDEQQRKDPIDALAGILQEMENGIFQVSIMPRKIGDSEVGSLQSAYRRAVEAAETTVTKERSGLFSGERQESKRIVDAKAMRKSELLKRRLERLSGGHVCDTRVVAASWGRDIAEADLDARRLAGAVAGALRPDIDGEDFEVRYHRHQRELDRLLSGLPIGSASTLTPSEAACYLIIPKTDLGIRVTSRERFSSGTTTSVAEHHDTEQRYAFQCNVPTSVQWKSRIEQIIYGNPISESGKPIENSYVTSDIRYYGSHLEILGTTQSGKTYTAISIIGQAIAHGVNPVVLIPSKAYEWRMLMDIFPDLRDFTAGDGNTALLKLNFWDPPPNVKLSKWVDRVVQVLTFWMPNDKVISMHVEDWVHIIYDRCGWDLDNETKGRPILFEDIVDGVIQFGEGLNYAEEVNRNFYGALVARVKSLLRKPALVQMFNTMTGLSIPELLAHPTIIEMDNLSQSDKVLLMGMLTAAISEYKLANPSERVENLLVLEEAHYILGKTDLEGAANSGARQQAVRTFIEMLRVLGGTGLGLAVIDQLPSSLVDEVVKLPVNVILHRLKEDRRTMEMLGSHVGCTDAQMQHIRGMQRGEAVVYLEREGEPKNVRILPLSFYIKDKLRVGRRSDSDVREHMSKFFEEHPELSVSESLPAGLIDRLVGHAKPSVRESPENHTGFERFWANTDFDAFCKTHVGQGTEESVKELAKVLLKVVRTLEDGKLSTAIRLAEHVIDHYCEDGSDGLLGRLTSEITRQAHERG